MARHPNNWQTVRTPPKLSKKGKNLLFLAFSLDVLLRQCKLVCVLWTCLTKTIKKDSIDFLKTLMFIRMQKINFITHFFLEILYNTYFDCFRHAWPCPSNMVVSTCWNFGVYQHKNQLYSWLLSWDIAKILQTCYFGYFGHDWQCPSK